MVVQVDTSLSPLHLQLLTKTCASVLEGNTFATITQVTHVEDHQIVLQTSQLPLCATTVRTPLKLTHETPAFVLQHTEVLVVDTQQHLVQLLVTDVIAETVALAVGTVAEIDLVLSRDFDLDVVEEDCLHPSVRLVHFFVRSVAVGILVTPLVVCTDDSIVAFVGGQPEVVVTSLESELFQLFTQTDLPVLEGNTLATEAVVVLIEHQVFTLQT